MKEAYIRKQRYARSEQSNMIHNSVPLNLIYRIQVCLNITFSFNMRYMTPRKITSE